MSLTNFDLVEIKMLSPGESSLVARVDIAKDAFLGCFDGRATLFPNAVGKNSTTLGDSPHKDIFQVSQYSGFLIGLVPVDSFGGIDFANHSCTPNCRIERGIVLVADRDIAKGEELTFDYRLVDQVPEGISCWCNPPKCRI